MERALRAAADRAAELMRASKAAAEAGRALSVLRHGGSGGGSGVLNALLAEGEAALTRATSGKVAAMAAKFSGAAALVAADAYSPDISSIMHA